MLHRMETREQTANVVEIGREKAGGRILFVVVAKSEARSSDISGPLPRWELQGTNIRHNFEFLSFKEGMHVCIQ